MTPRAAAQVAAAPGVCGAGVYGCQRSFVRVAGWALWAREWCTTFMLRRKKDNRVVVSSNKKRGS